MAKAEPLEPPTLKVTLQIEQERAGGCAELRAGRRGVQPALVMIHLCHGWTTKSCGGALLVHAIGVKEDQARVLFMDQNRSIDLVQPIDRAIRARWPRNQHLDLSFGNPVCEGPGVAVPFAASRTAAKESGPAFGLTGVAHAKGPHDVQVRVESAD